MWIDVKQNTEEWFNLRLGLATSSNFGKIMANYGKPFGKPAIEYAQKIALEIVTKLRDETGGYKSSMMERGNDLECVARELYEIETFTEITNGGFNVLKKLGDSPDGNVGKDGCVEIKTVIPNTHWRILKDGGYDTGYKWQIQGHLLVGEKKWCDFIQYCPEMPENKQLYIFRVERDEEMLEKMEIRFKEFFIEVEKNIDILNS